MDTGIGATLRETRTRRKVDLDEVEAATKIRARYLLALENEEWDLLPGGAYTRGFIRTYASYLGLDGERLAEEYRRSTAPPGGERAPRRVEPALTGRRSNRPRRPSGPVWVAAVSIVLVGALVAIGLTGRGDGGSSRTSPATGSRETGSQPSPDDNAPADRLGVTLQVTAAAEVWVCLLDGKGEPLIDGQVLEAGAEEGPFRSGGFTVSFGNGAVDVLLDGNRAEIPETSSPIGFEVEADGSLRQLSEAERPTCT